MSPLQKFIVGSVFHPFKKIYVPAVGYEFSDSPGFYQFFVVGSNDHFRKAPDGNDNISSITFEIFDEFRKVRGVL